MPKTPIIKGLWMLWNTESEDWVSAYDDPDPYIAYLCARNFKGAVALQKHQREMYDVKSVPIRVI